MNLSKYQLLLGLKCSKFLWQEKYKPQEKVINEDKSQLQNRIYVENVARGLFPGGYEIQSSDIEDGFSNTKKLINEEKTIYKGVLSYEDIYSYYDILNFSDEGLDIYNVRASTKLNWDYIRDLAIQYYIASKNEVKINSVNIIYINKDYIRNKDLDLNKLFIIENVTDDIKSYLKNIEIEVNNLKEILNNDEPKVDIDIHCLEPRECMYKDYCFRHIPKNSVFDLANANKKKKFDFYKQGLISFEDLYNSAYKNLSKVQRMQLESELTGKIFINKKAIKNFLEKFKYPIYFLDFETFQQPIPTYNNSKPYEQIPFQYSLHYIEEKDSVLKHAEFIAQPGKDQTREFAESLIENIPKVVTVVAYNMQFEKMIIKNLASKYIDLSDYLMNIHDNFVDLMEPFRDKHYYTKEMKGSYSIKYVLPALCYYDEDLDYNKLNIQNGYMAMSAYANLDLVNEDEKNNVIQDLLKYCYLDTLAMVKIWQKLNEVVYNN